MKILALDTATEACSVALAVGEREIHRHVELGRGHAERILPMIHELLAEGGIGLASLDAIAFGRGPGGFTGVRLAASVAQGLAFGAGVGVVPVSDLAAVAQQVLQREPDVRQVLAVNDARMREVYWGHFTVQAGGVEARGAEQVTPENQVLLPDAAGGPWAAAGRGLAISPELARRCAAAGASLYPELLPRALEILRLARPQVARGRVLPAEAALPVYVRDRVVSTGPS
jgi:tRNA threonylcarbamoyladenosine biosynthesis protein TsaB